MVASEPTHKPHRSMLIRVGVYTGYSVEGLGGQVVLVAGHFFGLAFEGLGGWICVKLCGLLGCGV